MISLQARPFDRPAERLGRLQRLSAALLGLTALAVWDPAAHPGPKLCLLRHAVGLPCPLCGMSRGVSCSLHGHFHQASTFNPLAVPVLLLALGLCVKWGLEYATGRRLDIHFSRRLLRAAVVVVHLAVLAAWAYLLRYRVEDDFAASWLGRLLRW
jgi:hypothetical protein